MSLVALESEGHGSRVEFSLLHFTSRGLTIACLLIGVLIAAVGMTERAAIKNVQWLAWGLGLFFIALALLTFYQRHRQKQNPYVAIIGALRYVWRPANDGPGQRFEIDLKDVARTLWLVDRYHRRLLVESQGRTLSLLGGWKLADADEARFISILERRAALCRAGVDSREEMAAAEAWLTQAQAGRRPVAIAVERKSKRFSLWAADDEAAVREALDKQRSVYVPERSHRMLSESIGAELLPLHGVD